MNETTVTAGTVVFGLPRNDMDLSRGRSLNPVTRATSRKNRALNGMNELILESSKLKLYKPLHSKYI